MCQHFNLTSTIFFNHCFDKRRFNNFLRWFLKNHGQYPLLNFLEKLKFVGFHSATETAFSISIEDLQIPSSKSQLLLTAEQNVLEADFQLMRGNLTVIERSQRILDIWNRTSEKFKYQVLQSFQKSDLFNPVYLMAFSGARGNISQIRQLVGMRGLMADPQGQIIDFPIRSNFREGLTLTEYLISCSGARKGIVDTALRTAASGYLTRRLVDVAHHVIISQIDCHTKKGLVVEDLYIQQKKVLSLQQRLVGRICAETIISNGAFICLQNQEISKSLSQTIGEHRKSLLIRSPLTCDSPKFICQFCYGWNLAEGQLVSVGEAVGILAAQSIGEPGTQLTMRTFHTGGVFTGNLLDQTYAPFVGNVYYNSACSGVLIRTQQGQIAYLSKNAGFLKIQPATTGQHHIQLDFQSGTLLYVRQGEQVLPNQLIAELPFFEQEQLFETEQPVFSPICGEMFFENFVFMEKTQFDIILEKNKIVQNLGEFWILSGQLFTHSIPHSSFFKKFDLIDSSTPSRQMLLKYDSDNVHSSVLPHRTFKKLGYGITLLNPAYSTNQVLPISALPETDLQFHLNSSKGAKLRLTVKFKHQFFCEFQTESLNFGGCNECIEARLLNVNRFGILQTPIPKPSYCLSNLGFCFPFTANQRTENCVKENCVKENCVKENCVKENCVPFVLNFPKTWMRKNRVLKPKLVNWLTTPNHKSFFLINALWLLNCSPQLTRVVQSIRLKDLKFGFCVNLRFLIFLKFQNGELSYGELQQAMQFNRWFKTKSVKTLFTNFFVQSITRVFSTTFSQARKNVYTSGDRIQEWNSLLMMRLCNKLLQKHDFFKPFVQRNLQHVYITNDILSKNNDFESAHQHKWLFLGTMNFVQSTATYNKNWRASSLNNCSILHSKVLCQSTTKPVLLFETILPPHGELGYRKTEKTKINRLKNGRSFFKLSKQLLFCVQPWFSSAAQQSFFCKKDYLIKNFQCRFVVAWPTKPICSTLQLNFVPTQLTIPNKFYNKASFSEFFDNAIDFQNLKIKFIAKKSGRQNVKFFETRKPHKGCYVKSQYWTRSFRSQLVPSILTGMQQNHKQYEPKYCAANQIYHRTFYGSSLRDKQYVIFTNKNQDNFYWFCLKTYPRGASHQFKVLCSQYFFKLPTFLKTLVGSKTVRLCSSNTMVQSTIQRGIVLKFSFYKQVKNLLSFQWYEAQSGHKHTHEQQHNVLKLLKLEHSNYLKLLKKQTQSFEMQIFVRVCLIPQNSEIVASNFDSMIGTTLSNMFAIKTKHKPIIQFHLSGLFGSKNKLGSKHCECLPFRKTFLTTATGDGSTMGTFRRGGEPVGNQCVFNGGLLIAQTQNGLLFRRAQNYLLNAKSILYVEHGESISQNQHVCSVFYSQSKTGDIVQGIPKIEQIFEARQSGESHFRAIFSKHILGAAIICKYLQSVQKSVVNNIQRIYCGQGIHISDKHIEIIVRQMTSNVLVLNPGPTGLLCGEIVALQWVERIQITHQIMYEPIIMGMTKTCLETSSFLSAASFQETTRILGRAAIQNQMDFIRGLKQNVILGNLIPVGTGCF